jgi:hypothetical protein
MKAKYILMPLLVVLTILIGQSYFGQLHIARALLNLPLIFSVLICFFSKDDLFNLISISLFAFVLELNSVNYGFNFLAFIILWFVVRYAVRLISQKNVLSFVFIAFISCLTYQLLFYIYSLLNHSINRYFNWQSLIYNFIVLAVIYFVYDFAKKKIQS